jgi:uncharacterized protein (DUF488 family)
LSRATPKQRIPISTIGHSTRPIEEFIRILEAHNIRQLVDVRTIPRSRHNPQFDQANLPESLAGAGIAYRHMPGLGGLRRASADSINTGWRNASFRGYADYMQTDAFREELEELIALSAEQPTAIMCAETVPWRCHRSLIADALAARGIEVIEILSATEARLHAMTPFARVRGVDVTYPGNAENAQFTFDASERIG